MVLGGISKIVIRVISINYSCKITGDQKLLLVGPGGVDLAVVSPGGNDLVVVIAAGGIDLVVSSPQALALVQDLAVVLSPGAWDRDGLGFWNV